MAEINLSEAEQDNERQKKAEECARAMLSDTNNTTQDGDLFCPISWDGLLCWPQTLADTTRFLPCPSYVIGVDPQSAASKFCLPEGRWYYHQDHQTLWTNYSKCFPADLATVHTNFSLEQENLTHTIFADYFPFVKATAQAGYGLSLISLVVAFTILAAVKKLRCPRNTLHMHLFVSFIFRAAMSIIKDKLFLQGVGMAADVSDKNGSKWFVVPFEGNNWECKLVTSLWQYSIMSNYSWILMEGLYLHNLIFMALFSDNSSITIYVILGWGMPLLFITPWVIMRLTLEDTLCWTTHHNDMLFLVIRVATTAFVLINFFLFINIVRVLLLKLRASVCKETRTYRRWAKSTLVLVPLFGVHYTVFLGMSFYDDQNVEMVWLFCDQLFASFQGFFVAVLYCFLNGEVLAELGKKWHRLRCSRRDRRLNQLGSFNGRPRNSYSNTSCLSIGVPKFMPRYGKPSVNRKLCSQYTDNSQMSCCSNVRTILADTGNTDSIVPGLMEMRFIKPQ